MARLCLAKKSKVAGSRYARDPESVSHWIKIGASGIVGALRWGCRSCFSEVVNGQPRNGDAIRFRRRGQKMLDEHFRQVLVRPGSCLEVCREPAEKLGWSGAVALRISHWFSPRNVVEPMRGPASYRRSYKLL